MSEIDRIEDNAVAAIRDAITNGDDFRVWVRAALLEYGQIVREECAKACDRQASLPECPERATYCADAIRNANKGAP